MLFKEKPENFSPRFEIVSCFIEHNGKFLFLKRLPEKTQGGKWGVPGGKVDAGESTEEALLRELREETGLNLSAESPAYFDKVFVRYPDYDFVYQMFSVKLNDRPVVKICAKEHEAHDWWDLEDAIERDDLVLDEDGCIKMFCGLK